MLSNSTDNAREKAAYRKELDALQAKIDECRIYDQVVSHIAHQQIDLDLDDGMKVNYAKFQGVVVPKDDGKTETMDLLGRYSTVESVNSKIIMYQTEDGLTKIEVEMSGETV